MVKLSEIELPLVYKRTPLFKAGEWNNLSFSKGVVENSVKDTKWSSLNKRLYTFHDNATKFGEWNGKVENIEVENGTVFGDVEVWDADKALKLLHGGSPFAISADIEYQQNNVGEIDRVIFTGFALEYDPGIRDINMYLSDAVRNEMNNSFHARFSNVVETKPIVEEKANSDDIKQALNEINNKIDSINSIERRELNGNAKMEEDNKPSKESDETNKPKEEVKTNVEPNTLELKVKELEAKIQEMSKPKVEAQPVKETESKATIVESKSTDPTPKVITMDESLMTNMVEKIVDKMKPMPMTINEFGGESKDPEEVTIDRLAESLANQNG